MFVSVSIFAVALVLLCMLFALKHHELSHGRRFLFGRHRAAADRHVVRAAAALEERVPRRGRELTVRSAHSALYHTSKTIHGGVSSLERRLHAFTDVVKGRRDLKERNGSASFYLKDIAEHKRQNGFKRDF